MLRIFFRRRKLNGGERASDVTPEALDAISAHIGTHFITFRIESDEEEFKQAIKNAIRLGEIIRTHITPDNLKQVFDKWVEMIGQEISGVTEEDYALLFFADIMHDGTVSTHDNLSAELLHKGNAPVFSLGDKLYELDSVEGYNRFWQIYQKPPKKEYRDYLLERRDSLIPLNKRIFEGAYYTPLPVVDRAYDKLSDVLGKRWQSRYIVWDMCCGVGNLEVKHSNPRRIFMSTLDEADVDVMKATKTCPQAMRFQYDYLNDDISEDGNIDYSLTNKVPKELQKAIANDEKILILINPPYAEATNFKNIADGDKAENKKGVAKTKCAKLLMSDYGKASNELFAQFLARIAIEIPNATVAMFSTLKYVNAPNFEIFRKIWTAKYLGGFVVHNKTFDGLTGKFPIGFLVWQTDKSEPITEVEVDVYDKFVNPIGVKRIYSLPKSSYLNVWLKRPKKNGIEVIPLKNSISPSVTKPRVRHWSDNAIAYMYCGVNDLQHAEQQTVIYSSPYGGGNGFYITPNNLEQASIIFTVRRLIKPTWLNDRDQFLQPNSELSNEFKNDCLVWMLFNRCQRTASANDLEWNGKKWSIVSHFIPYTESEVDSPERFESDFMVNFLKHRTFSTESKALLREGKRLWKAYFLHTDARGVREEFKLNRPDVGWFQVRKTLERRNEIGTNSSVNFTAFENAYQDLTEKLQPQVFSYGFLKR